MNREEMIRLLQFEYQAILAANPDFGISERQFLELGLLDHVWEARLSLDLGPVAVCAVHAHHC